MFGAQFEFCRVQICMPHSPLRIVHALAYIEASVEIINIAVFETSVHFYQKAYKESKCLYLL